MEILCTRPSCHTENTFADLDDSDRIQTIQQKYCTRCGMPLILGARYLPMKLLGQGGFGAAFLARDRFTTSLRECVVKQFQPSGDLSPQQLQIAQKLFEREAAVLEELGNEHKQIPNSYAYFPVVVPRPGSQKDEQFFYLVQQFIDGQDLEQEQEEKGVYSQEEVLEVLQAILGVLGFVHAENVIHRDIKPSNIMRSRSDGRLYLLDFGAVKQITATVGTPSGRSTGIYSMGFAPPEQMQASQVFPATDLYALAATCLVLLTNKPPEELFDTYNNCWDWRSHAPQVSDGLADILDKMLRPVPRDRFSSAREVLEAIASLNSSPSRPIAPPTAPPPIPTQPKPTTVQGSTSPPPIPPTPVSPPPPVSPPTLVSQPPQSGGISTVEIITSAAFTGFEGALLWMALTSIIQEINPISIGLLGMSLGGLIYAQFRHIIEKWDLAILGGITFGLVAFIGFFHRNEGLQSLLQSFIQPQFLGIFFIAIFVGAASVAITTLFLLIYKTLSKML
ncbi:serine/threonine-protein kinase [Spirulina sp. 06S082]|uniref:serine/threonine-protein kinase n=1 Tax=Spirulina sp. 06S082 TaxID=3110248 RepID=UPI002B21EB06|nr:serine/threonine-protein kinase [Spirulina sp. 06S082]MEA5471344.1 serine/threonine-protein kinase [Spirulina sp. 06S082]